MRCCFGVLLVAMLAACGGDGGRIRAVPFAQLDGFATAEILPALPAFRRTCSRRGAPPSAIAKPADWEGACAAADAVVSEAEAKAWLAQHFTPVVIGPGTALVTGYFEPVFDASAEPNAVHSAPVLARPRDLVTVDLGAFRPELAGERIAGRVVGGRLLPYPDRAAIADSPPEDAAVMAYMHPDDLFFLQIQGSGVLRMEDGWRRVGYAAQNGHPYHAIGKTLVDDGEMQLDDVTMQSIRTWLNEASEDDAARVRHTNPSYVFFADRGSAVGGEGPIGTAGVPLTPEVSVAVDPAVIPLGAPVWIVGDSAPLKLHGLHIAQDTGGAIRGAGRLDLFLGRGAEAGEIAGRLKLEARVAILLPNPAARRLLEASS